MRIESPYQGVVYAFNCAGRPIDEMRLGYVLDWRAGPSAGGLPTVEVRYVAGTGTGFWTTWVGLLQQRGGKLHELWSHIAVDSFGGPGPNVATRNRWRYLDGGRRIRVTGVKTTGPIRNFREGRADGKTEAVPVEAYCYVASIARYRPCGQAPTASRP